MNVIIEKGDGYGFFDQIDQDKIYYPFSWLSEGLPEPSEVRIPTTLKETPICTAMDQ